ncbi:MAG: AAA family ATPase [Candidatus Ancillula sp.]|jgi:DNA replication and repair protein RecF|nr:AAA family ATPase [Candidatus Ancillula sp.]
MPIQEVELVNFRNHKYKNITFKPNVNILVGKNGVGKTSILEAIYIKSEKKSFKTTHLKQTITYNENKSQINIISEKNKKFNVTLFSPETTVDLFYSSEQKRNIIDQEIKKNDVKYKKELQEFNKILIQRNKLLKNYSKHKITNKEFEYIKIWNQQFLEKSLIISKKRKEYLNKIKQYITDKYNKIVEKKEENIIEIEFISSPKILTEDNMKKIMIENFEKEKILGFSLEGCQKDNFQIYLKGEKSKGNISQGEAWSITYAFVLSENEIIKNQIQNKIENILLLDDLFISLDKTRKRKVIDILKKESQAIITTTNSENLNIFNKKNGINIIKMN